eukprot:12898992-Prorocentrum_lima.AAC.1
MKETLMAGDPMNEARLEEDVRGQARPQAHDDGPGDEAREGGEEVPEGVGGAGDVLKGEPPEELEAAPT